MIYYMVFQEINRSRKIYKKRGNVWANNPKQAILKASLSLKRDGFDHVKSIVVVPEKYFHRKGWFLK